MKRKCFVLYDNGGVLSGFPVVYKYIKKQFKETLQKKEGIIKNGQSLDKP
jgi:hypothetical protein